MTISQLEEAGIRKVATKVTTTLNCLEGAVQPMSDTDSLRVTMRASDLKRSQAETYVVQNTSFSR